jgi:hypothetical protein
MWMMGMMALDTLSVMYLIFLIFFERSSPPCMRATSFTEQLPGVRSLCELHHV